MHLCDGLTFELPDREFTTAIASAEHAGFVEVVSTLEVATTLRNY